MNPISLENLLDTLRTCRILTSPQLTELSKLVPENANDPQALAQELVRRAWLSPFQAKQLLLGRGVHLVFGPYLILERLGGGGNGQVFRARHQAMDRVVALKVLRKDLLADADAVGRFHREVEVISQLTHPCIIHAYDAGVVGSTHFLAMEYVDGADLDRLVRDSGPLPVPQACDYVRQAALGLQYAHDRGLVHRDIKPSNLLVSRRSGDSVAANPTQQVVGLTPWGSIKILDLGLARLQQPVAGTRTRNLTVLAGNGVMLGTPDYMAPEQAIDFHNADIRADIYSLGCTLFFMLTGRPPFAGGSVSQKLIGHHQIEPPSVANLRADVPSGLASILAKMLAKRPCDRYQLPGEVSKALTDLLATLGPAAGDVVEHSTGGVVAESPSTTEMCKTATLTSGRFPLEGTGGVGSTTTEEQDATRRPIPLRHRRVALVAAAAALFVGGVSIAWFLLGGRGEPGQTAQLVALTPAEAPGSPIRKEPEPVYLCDLPERDVAVGYGSFGKKGDLGYENKRITFNGVSSPHGLSMHPPDRGSARVAYALKRQYQSFRAKAAMNDDIDGSETALIFKVWGDGKPLWQSKPLKKRGEGEECTVPVATIERLELEVYCPGSFGKAHAVWVEPLLLK